MRILFDFLLILSIAVWFAVVYGCDTKGICAGGDDFTSKPYYPKFNKWLA